MTLHRPRTRAGHRETGQTLVEFALVFPIFLLLLFAVIEFAFVFSGMLGISYATRDAALLAAEAGSLTGADCVIIKAVDQALSAPASEDRIQSIVIYRADANGVEMTGVANTWTRTGTTVCPSGLGQIPYVPDSATPFGYVEADRCNVLKGCPANGAGTHAGPDTIGVRVVYAHQWVTPLGSFGGLGGPGFTLTQSNSMRVEPVL